MLRQAQHDRLSGECSIGAATVIITKAFSVKIFNNCAYNNMITFAPNFEHWKLLKN
ncbi:hypothetical protein GCM10011425_06270 [Mucilaginibacter galii]|uniref:Uncharacterized protein n=1 Tax=Mucilaginibacter galii TaxID=2005073 RepID=A0A917N044_9SPHI|nr:hypothetical protein GCM10011425_06270 [Mucilaginibacter galii]